MKKRLMMLLSILLTLFFLFYIIVKIDWSQFALIIGDLNYLILGVSAFTYLFSYFLRAIRFKLLLGDDSIKTSQLLGISFLHNFYNRIIPARLGDFSLIYLLNKLSKRTYHSSVNVFIYVKLYDLFVSALLLAVSYSAIYNFDMICVGLWVITVLILALTLKPSIILGYLQKFTNRFSKWKLINKLNKGIISLIQNSKQVETNRLRCLLLITTLGIWLLIFVLFFSLFLSLNKNFGVLNTLFATTLANFSWVLPINGVGGFGTMEVSMAFAFSMRGYSFHDLLLYSLYINVVVFILSTLFAIIPYYKLLRRVNSDETNHTNPMPQ